MADEPYTKSEQEELHTFRLQDVFDKRYAKIDEVFLIRRIVFGAVSLILTTVFLAVISTALKLHA